MIKNAILKDLFIYLNSKAISLRFLGVCGDNADIVDEVGDVVGRCECSAQCVQ